MVIPRKLTISKGVVGLKHHTKTKGDLGVLKAQHNFERSITLRVKTPKNNQTKYIHNAIDYREVP